MLETLHLTKTYKPKKGVAVKALDDVSIRFPDTGMVFLLGKSGSGKSTLLNLLGGLDKYDSGEILIGGVSSRSFKQKQFDSYRNTYVGFIFQEYNLLDEFSVGANIALALQLQGQQASDERINEILEQVDLAGFGTRKPNELSGGQKQRVAIARALVKNPHIIMADEPTGALDSATGRQVLDTLKKLSGDKLVVIVSHDREFAEQYADRIIELSDGKVISDMEYDGRESEELQFVGNNITLPKAYHLTEEDRQRINEYIDAMESGITLQLGAARGRATDTSKIAERTGGIHLIKSKLPMRFAFKMGSTALKYKKIRLSITILLSCIAFGLFGLADTFGAYDHIRTCTDSIIDSEITYASVTRNVKHTQDNYTYYSSGHSLTTEELTEIETQTGVKMLGVFSPRAGELNFSAQYDNEAPFTETDYHIYASYFSGYCALSDNQLQSFGYRITSGRLPEGNKAEIALSKYVAQTFVIGGYSATGTAPFEKIGDPAQLVGKTLALDGVTYTIVGIVDTDLDMARYERLTKAAAGEISTAEELVNYVLSSELRYIRNYSLHQTALVSQEYLETLMASQPNTISCNNGYIGGYDANDNYFDPYYVGNLSDNAQSVIWLGETKEILADNEIVLSTDILEQMGYSVEQATDLSVGMYKHSFYDDFEAINEQDIKVVGVIDTAAHPQYVGTMLCSAKWSAHLGDEDGIYTYAVGVMPEGRGDIEQLVSYCYTDHSDTKYPLMNAVTYQLDTVNEVLVVLADVFLYIGLGFALFAALMLANFISTSISYKKQQIGILRAIGSRSADVFRIFFSESFIIAMINFVLSSVGVGAATAIINYFIRHNYGVYITVLSFGVRQVVLLLLISLLTAALASFFPVYRIAAKRPIDAIRSK